MEVIEIVLWSIGGTSTLLLMAGFLGKSVLSQVLAKDIENYKSEISQENSIQLEKLKADLSDQSNEKERRLQKLEELHCLLMEINLRLYVKYHDVCTMVERGFAYEQVVAYLGSQALGQESYILQSRIKSLASIYAGNISSDSGEKTAALMKEIEHFGSLHQSGQNTETDLVKLKESLEEFRISVNKYMDGICNAITQS